MPIPFIPNCEQPFTEFVFLQDSLRFGADKQLTVVTGYLVPCTALIDLAKQDMPINAQYEPNAFVLSYDAECNNIGLYCIDEFDQPHLLPLSAPMINSLYTALLSRVEQLYGYSPKEVLNMIRGYANLSPLT